MEKLIVSVSHTQWKELKDIGMSVIKLSVHLHIFTISDPFLVSHKLNMSNYDLLSLLNFADYHVVDHVYI